MSDEHGVPGVPGVPVFRFLMRVACCIISFFFQAVSKWLLNKLLVCVPAIFQCSNVGVYFYFAFAFE